MSSIRKAESDATAKKIGIATATQTIKTYTLRQGITTVAQVGVQHTVGDDIQQEIERKVGKTIANTLAASHTIQRAIAADIKHTRNGLQGRVISRGLQRKMEKNERDGVADALKNIFGYESFVIKEKIDVEPGECPYEFDFTPNKKLKRIKK